ncbi:hypothetical protein NUW54_g329 [Trametes sanguinea]|uniref:Uncharacterized protein n=1 Tax=Trametes sanguinea TaxID=158606 RepID=A0ACC1QCH7_9APHY|nr:hypothetical protein NUW54_g329 [Trametes sanguinea]
MALLPRYLGCSARRSPAKKGRRRPGIPSWRDEGSDLEYHSDGSIDYANLQPLDGEEGELIDDEACFIDVRAITGMDILSHLPTELALELLSYLDLPSILACLRVSKTWNRLARDNSVWRVLFSRKVQDGWGVDLRRASRTHPLSSTNASLSASRSIIPAPLEIKWYDLYRTRTELDRRWSNYPTAGLSADLSDDAMAEEKTVPKAWEPQVMRISGHSDSVYCLEFDSSRIITGSRDRTIKVWSLKTGQCLATFSGHRGSVLCLKFDRDWDIAEAKDGADNVDPLAPRKGFLVTGSSDCTVCVWNLYAHPREGAEPAITADVIRELQVLLGSVREGCDPEVFYNVIRPWFKGADSDTTGRKWHFDGIELDPTLEEPTELSGPSAGQSSLIHALDVFLGVDQVTHTNFAVGRPKTDASSSSSDAKPSAPSEAPASAPAAASRILGRLTKAE